MEQSNTQWHYPEYFSLSAHVRRISSDTANMATETKNNVTWVNYSFVADCKSRAFYSKRVADFLAEQ